jgi:hypothetical protein
MSGVLFIGEAEKAEIAAAVLAARARPIPLALLQEVAIDAADKHTLTLSERQHARRIAEIRRDYPSQRLQLGTYTVSISFEQQPRGLFRHISISSRDPGKVPGERVVEMVLPAFGFSGWPPTKAYHVWVEEFEPGHNAINIVELVEP